MCLRRQKSRFGELLVLNGAEYHGVTAAEAAAMKRVVERPEGMSTRTGIAMTDTENVSLQAHAAVNEVGRMTSVKLR